jgi:hypothetical protein
MRDTAVFITTCAPEAAILRSASSDTPPVSVWAQTSIMLSGVPSP